MKKDELVVTISFVPTDGQVLSVTAWKAVRPSSAAQAALCRGRPPAATSKWSWRSTAPMTSQLMPETLLLAWHRHLAKAHSSNRDRLSGCQFAGFANLVASAVPTSFGMLPSENLVCACNQLCANPEKQRRSARRLRGTAADVPRKLRSCLCIASLITLRPTTTLGLQIAQSRSYLCTLGPKVGIICILGALGPETGAPRDGQPRVIQEAL